MQNTLEIKWKRRHHSLILFAEVCEREKRFVCEIEKIDDAFAYRLFRNSRINTIGNAKTEEKAKEICIDIIEKFLS